MNDIVSQRCSVLVCLNEHKTLQTCFQHWEIRSRHCFIDFGEDLPCLYHRHGQCCHDLQMHCSIGQLHISFGTALQCEHSSIDYLPLSITSSSPLFSPQFKLGWQIMHCDEGLINWGASSAVWTTDPTIFSLSSLSGGNCHDCPLATPLYVRPLLEHNSALLTLCGLTGLTSRTLQPPEMA